MQYVEVVHGGEAGPARVRVDPEHVEVVSAPVRGHQQHAARVELQRYYRFRVSDEVGHYRVALLVVVLTFLYVETLALTIHISLL